MIYCAHCGTENRDGSRFCSNCGARLALPPGLICPMCSTPNPVESVFCGSCGARLLPLTSGTESEKTQAPAPIRGLSLPTKAPPAPPSVPAEETRPPEAPTPGPSDIPEWLAGLTLPTSPSVPAEETRPPEAPTPGPSDIPEWLGGLTLSAPPSIPAEETRPPEAPTPGPSDIPEWLGGLTLPASPSVPAEETRPPEAPAPSPSDITQWLASLRAAPPTEEEPPPAAAAKEEEEPLWLKNLREQQVPTESPPLPKREEEEPTWVRKLREATPKVEAVPSTSAPEAEIPESLKELETQTAAEPTETIATEEPKTSEPVELLKTTETEPPAWFTTAAPKEPAHEEEVPEWLRLAAPSEQVAKKAGEELKTAEPEIQPALPQEIPQWVASLKPSEAVLPPLPVRFEDEPAEPSGPLAGLRGVLPLAVAVTKPHPPKTGEQAEQKNGAHFFDAILAAPTAAATAIPRERARRVRTIRPLVYLLLAFAVIVPFLIPHDLAGSTLRISGTAAAEFYDTLQALPNNATVLLAFDYDPSLSSEMDLQANAIVRHLIQRRVKIIALSTLETGPQIAQRVLNKAAAGASNYRYGVNYLNLGFLPGHEAGLAQLAAKGLSADAQDFVQKQNLKQFPAAANIKTLRDVALVIELAGSEEPLKMWMEQVQARTNARIAAGVSAAVEPKARAYRDAKQLVALMSGLIGAAQYEILSNQPGLAATSADAQGAAQIILVLIIVLGNIVFWFSRAVRNT